MKGFKLSLQYCLFILLFGWIGQGCNIINPHEQVPTYIHVDSFTFVKDSVNSSLSTTHQINSVWAYYNNSPVGVFDLPATFPIPAVGNGKLTLYPGIALDGLNSFLTTYPFYYGDTGAIVAQPGKIINYVPKTGYYKAAKNVQITQGNFTGFLPLTGATALTYDAGVYTITLNQPNDTLSEISSAKTYALAIGADEYLEFDYKNTVPFYVGVQANLVGSGYVEKIYLSGINPSDHWQKFYLSLKDFVAQYKADSYTIYIKAGLDPGQSSGKVYLNRIQILYFD